MESFKHSEKRTFIINRIAIILSIVSDSNFREQNLLGRNFQWCMFIPFSQHFKFLALELSNQVLEKLKHP